MKIFLNPQVSFKSSNLIEDAVNRSRQPKNQTIPEGAGNGLSSGGKDGYIRQLSKDELKKSVDEFKEALKEGKSVDGIIRGTHWEKVYNSEDDTVHLKIPNSYDGNEYTVYSDGKVVVTNGWGKNEVEMEANERMAKYVKAMKEGKVDEYLAELEQVELKSNGNSLASNKSKAELFKKTLHDRQWKKEYLPESDIIVIRNKRVKDGVEYMIEKDGTVKEFGLRIKPTVIIEPSIEGAKEFGKLKEKLNNKNPNEPTSLWYKMKKGVANVWKFFSVTGTMAAATVKGAVEGVVAGAGVFALTSVVRGIYNVAFKNAKVLEVLKNPLQTAGKTGGSLAIFAFGAALIYEAVAGKLKANQNSAVIEHKMDVEHNLK